MESNVYFYFCIHSPNIFTHPQKAVDQGEGVMSLSVEMCNTYPKGQFKWSLKRVQIADDLAALTFYQVLVA